MKKPTLIVLIEALCGALVLVALYVGVAIFHSMVAGIALGLLPFIGGLYYWFWVRKNRVIFSFMLFAFFALQFLV